MQERTGRGRQDTADTERYEQRIEADDKVVIRVNAAHQRHAELPEEDQLAQIIGRNRDIRDLARNRCAVRNRNADIRLGKRRGIVHAVADHDNFAARRVFLPHELCLGARQNFRVEFVEMQLCGHGRRCLLRITGHHADLRNAEFPQSVDNLRCLLANRVKDADDCAELAVDCEIELRVLVRQRFELLLIAL